MEYDLCIDNYTLEELVGLFGVSTALTDKELHRVKRVAAMMHPDKSSLGNEVFLFFRQAAEILKQVSTDGRRTTSITYSNCFDGEASIPDELRDPATFSRNFNRLFDEYKRLSQPIDKGHGEWLKQNDITRFEAGSLADVHRTIERERAKLGQLIECKPVSSFTSDAGSAILGLENSNSPAPFTKLGFQDLRNAYEKNLIPSLQELPKRTISVLEKERAGLSKIKYKTDIPDTSLEDKIRKFSISREQSKVEQALSNMSINLLKQ